MQNNQRKTILVSSCLLGLDTRYNGVSKRNSTVLDFLTGGQWSIVPVCPEQLAGLPTPRPATRFAAGDGHQVLAGYGHVVDAHGETLDQLFIKGAEQVLEIARLNRCTVALLKERSPSCGVHRIDRNGTIVDGAGVTTALLMKNGVNVFNEEETGRIEHGRSGSQENDHART